MTKVMPKDTLGVATLSRFGLRRSTGHASITTSRLCFECMGPQCCKCPLNAAKHGCTGTTEHHRSPFRVIRGAERRKADFSLI